VDGADGKVLVKCHAGCSQAEVIGALRRLGLWPSHDPRARGLSMRRRGPASSRKRPFEDDNARIPYALEVWGQTRPAQGTVVEAYLRRRGLSLAIPETLRFHPNLKHAPTGTWWPAMVALITKGEDNTPIGVTRTFLAPDGTGKARIVPPR
jgi:putative DNA primase/helicase